MSTTRLARLQVDQNNGRCSTNTSTGKGNGTMISVVWVPPLQDQAQKPQGTVAHRCHMLVRTAISGSPWSKVFDDDHVEASQAKPVTGISFVLPV